MQYNKITYTIVLCLCFFFQNGYAKNESLQEIKKLINRVTPGQASRFDLEIISAEKDRDVFEIDKRNRTIVLRGNNVLSLAVAFNTYLKETALLSYDWQADKPLMLKSVLPLPATKTRRICSATERFFNNTCTFGYTFPYWGMNKWQRFIDWMAMNGINRPLMLAGQEAVWLQVWQSFGLTQKQILSYFSAPAHLPWHRMANMDRWGGPLPLSYIQAQQRLQVQLLNKCRKLGMKPVISAFAGHVPAELRKLYPLAKIETIEPGWGGMAPDYTTCYLDPEEPLFAEIQKRFLDYQQQLYGTDHLYSADPFNEITPPSWEPEYLAKVGQSIYKSMTASDPLAIWYQMSWTFYYDNKHWTQPRLAAMVNAVPHGKLVFLDYVCEETEYYRQSDFFHGAPFIWCYLGNFGGNTHLVAPVAKVVEKIKNIPAQSGCLGVGSTLEGINVNPIIYETVLETPWLNDSDRTPENLIRKYADRRAGQPDLYVRKAWEMLAQKVLVDSAVGIWTHSVIFQVSPLTDINKRHWTTDPAIPYKNSDLLKVVQLLGQADKASQKNEAYQFDLVNFTRQLLGNYGIALYYNMIAAYKQNNADEFKMTAKRFMTLGYEIDSLLGTRHEFLLGRWIADASGNGHSEAEKKYFERDAREIITTWHKGGGELNDYSNRQWNGLLRTYYLPRWEEFIRRINASLQSGEPFDQSSFDRWCGDFAQNWVDHCSEKFITEPQANPVTTAMTLIKKYEKAIAAVP
jgi:alpha-N-acetylglucosaminidase